MITFCIRHGQVKCIVTTAVCVSVHHYCADDPDVTLRIGSAVFAKYITVMVRQTDRHTQMDHVTKCVAIGHICATYSTVKPFNLATLKVGCLHAKLFWQIKATYKSIYCSNCVLFLTTVDICAL